MVFKIIHGDLAARNVLVFKSNAVKIADFGMSRHAGLTDLSGGQVSNTVYIQNLKCGENEVLQFQFQMIPWRWAAPELLSALEFSEGSDVWAFGITVWEIFSMGQTPYDDLEYGDICDFLRSGKRLTKPQLISMKMYGEWNGNPKVYYCELFQ